LAHIPIAVAADLGDPVVGIGLGLTRAACAVVAVPEAAVDEQSHAPALHHHIGLAGQARTAEAVSDAGLAQEAADGELGAGVLALHPPHDGAAFLGREDVGQGSVWVTSASEQVVSRDGAPGTTPHPLRSPALFTP
jgi:hypothetical protein